VILYQHHIFFLYENVSLPKASFVGSFVLLLKKSAIEWRRLLVEAYGERTCRDWFRRFKNGDFDVEDKERTGRSKSVEDTELEKYSMKIHVKCKKNLHNHWKLLNQPFPCVQNH